ncbi:hypothetical protein SAMN05444359_12431 [Neolewinella agarilytica]|uniref:Uncharacterized protein n=1 Tax=Neolewinella agarilytica TaxID=478744 RepID=A0A1H9LHL0_9BACT|nr:hypothetical protein SAMN05444359_12431 [Neolewinella agarilytica]
MGLKLPLQPATLEIAAFLEVVPLLINEVIMFQVIKQ